jgi:hypothetical protein
MITENYSCWIKLVTGVSKASHTIIKKGDEEVKEPVGGESSHPRKLKTEVPKAPQKLDGKINIMYKCYQKLYYINYV